MPIFYSAQRYLGDSLTHQRIQLALQLQERASAASAKIIAAERDGEVDHQEFGDECAKLLMLLYDMCRANGVDLSRASERNLEERRQRLQAIEDAFFSRGKSL